MQVTPIFKNGGISSTQNYRPISILSVKTTFKWNISLLSMVIYLTLVTQEVKSLVMFALRYLQVPTGVGWPLTCWLVNRCGQRVPLAEERLTTPEYAWQRGTVRLRAGKRLHGKYLATPPLHYPVLANQYLPLNPHGTFLCLSFYSKLRFCLSLKIWGKYAVTLYKFSGHFLGVSWLMKIQKSEWFDQNKVKLYYNLLG